MNSRKILSNGHETILQAISGLPEADWYQSGAAGEWSVKDIIAHLASFEMVLREVLLALDIGHDLATALRWVNNPEGFNQREVTQRRGLPAQRVWGEYESLHESNLLLSARLPDALYRKAGLLGWYGADYDLEDFIVYAFYGHKREHGAQIAAFSETLYRQQKLRNERARAAWQVQINAGAASK